MGLLRSLASEGQQYASYQRQKSGNDNRESQSTGSRSDSGARQSAAAHPRSSPGMTSGASLYTSPRNPPPHSRFDSPLDAPLQLPVIIPPSRPGSVDRGFRAAYAPMLEPAGIDQSTFLNFLYELNEGCKDSKALLPVEVACFAAGMVPSVIAMAQYVRHKVNVVLDQFNEQLFSPLGLYAMIMKYDPFLGAPDAANRRRKKGDGVFGQAAGMVGTMVTSSGKGGDDSWTRDYASGTIVSDGLPTEAAELIYLDDDAEWLGMIHGEKKGGLTGAYNNLSGYLDHRARNNYLAENGESVLTKGGGATIPPPQSSGGLNLLGGNDGGKLLGGRKSLPGGGGLGGGLGGGRVGGGLGGGKLSGALGKGIGGTVGKGLGGPVVKGIGGIVGKGVGMNAGKGIGGNGGGIRGKLGEGLKGSQGTAGLGDVLRNKQAARGNTRKIKENVIYLMIVNRPSDAMMREVQAHASEIPVAMVRE